MILAYVTHGYLIEDGSPLSIPVAPVGGAAIVDPRPPPPQGAAIAVVYTAPQNSGT